MKDPSPGNLGSKEKGIKEADVGQRSWHSSFGKRQKTLEGLIEEKPGIVRKAFF